MTAFCNGGDAFQQHQSLNNKKSFTNENLAFRGVNRGYHIGMSPVSPAVRPAVTGSQPSCISFVAEHVPVSWATVKDFNSSLTHWLLSCF